MTWHQINHVTSLYGIQLGIKNSLAIFNVAEQLYRWHLNKRTGVIWTNVQVVSGQTYRWYLGKRTGGIWTNVQVHLYKGTDGICTNV